MNYLHLYLKAQKDPPELLKQASLIRKGFDFAFCLNSQRQYRNDQPQSIRPSVVFIALLRKSRKIFTYTTEMRISVRHIDIQMLSDRLLYCKINQKSHERGTVIYSNSFQSPIGIGGMDTSIIILKKHDFYETSIRINRF